MVAAVAQVAVAAAVAAAVAFDSSGCWSANQPNWCWVAGCSMKKGVKVMVRQKKAVAG